MEGISQECGKYQCRRWKVVEDNSDEFPSVGRILDGMLKKVDSSNSVLQAYLKTINPSVETGILLSRIAKGPFKRSRSSKKKPKDTTGAIKPDAPLKEVVHSKTGVFKRLKKMAHRSQSSSDKYPSFLSIYGSKTHVTRKKVVTREVPVPISLSSKKQQVKDMAKHILRKQKKKLRKLVLNDESTKDEVLQDPPVTTSQVDTSNIEMIVVSSSVSQPERIIVSLPLTTNVETTLSQGTPIIVSLTFETSTIDTTITLPPFVTTPLDTHSPTSENIINQPVTSLFSSQSTDPPINTTEAHHSSDDDENIFGGTFGDIQFDPKEEEIPDNLILTGKQFKILNQKLNSLLQIQADRGRKHSPGSSPLITKEYLSQKFLLFEANLNKQLAPLSQLASILPKNSPPVVTGVQGGERTSVGEGASGKSGEEAKVVGKVFTTNIPLTNPFISKADPVISTVTTTRQVLKGRVIGSSCHTPKPEWRKHSGVDDFT
ncbi:unnamed protein product [Lactuca saligna]|uniref:Uncharacterized protein n=1 Tax=Lactuca saligna TaxID=75948 RepID=A0AA36EKM7_LACSI|nr:unnamed protein product [Lactuca saligna]